MTDHENGAASLGASWRRRDLFEKSQSRALIGADRLQHGGGFHAHLHRQRPTGHVVRKNRRPVRRLAQIWITLRFEELLDQRSEWLIHQDNPRSPLILAAVRGKRLDSLMNLDAVEHKLFHQSRGRRQVALLLRDHIRERRLLPESLDVVARRLIAVVEQRLAILRRSVKHGHRGAQHVTHRVAQPPPPAFPRTAVEDLGPQRLAVSRKLLDSVEVRRRIAVERSLGEERDAVPKDMSIVEKSRIPVVEPCAMDGAGHLALIQISRHVDPEYIQPARHQRMNVRRDRLDEGRDEDAGGKRRRLMMTIEDDRTPFQLGASHLLRFEHVVHVAVAIVVMTDVFLIEIGQRADLVWRAEIFSIPRDDLVLTVGIQCRPQHQNDVVQNGIYFGITLGRDKLVSQLNGVLRASHFSRVKAAVQVNDGLTFAGKGSCVFVTQSAAESQTAGDLFVFIEPRKILWGRDQRDLPIQTSCGFAHRIEIDPIRTRGQFAEVPAGLVVVGKVKIVAWFVTKNRLRSGDCLAHSGTRPDYRDKNRQNRGSDQLYPHSHIVMRSLIDVKDWAL